MLEGRAQQLGVTSLVDLAPIAPQLTVGGDPEFFERPDWEAVVDTYGLQFEEERSFSPTFMYNSLRSGAADVIGAYSSDGRILAERLTILDDPLEALPSYDAMIMLAPSVAGDKKLTRTLEPLIGAIDVEDMRRANFSVDREDEQKVSPDVAAERLSEQIGLSD